jgi:hypothetical protein
MAAPKLTPAQIRDRKAKRTAIVLSVVFLGVLAFQGPKILKMLHGSSSSSASATTAAVTTTAAGAVTGAPTAPTVPGVPSVVVPTGPPGVLAGFSRFAIKDPFHAQLGATPPVGTSGAPASTTATGSGAGANPPATTAAATTTSVPPKSPAKATTTTPAAIPVSGAPTASVPFTTTTPSVPPNAAVLRINGKKQIVGVDGVFPAGEPLFKLDRLGKNGKSIRISVLGGSFTSGDPWIALARGKTLTLANESDGTRYIVKLVKLTNAVLPAPNASNATAPTLGTTTPTKR